MPRNFHEQFSRADLPLPPDRSTGLVFVGVACIVAFIFRADAVVFRTALAVAALLALVSFFAPRFLRPLNIVWMRFALLLSRIVNPIVMMILFAIVIVPVGLIMRTRYDPLRKRQGDSKSTYWIDRQADRKSSMANQF